MSDGEVVIEVQGRDVSLSALLKKLEAQMRQTDAAANRAGASMGESLGAGANKATSSMLALQQAQARLEASQGNLAGAADRLRAALAQQSTTTTQTIAAQRQLQAVEAQQAAAADRAGRAVFQEAVSLARLQSASGNTAGAIRTLTTAQSQLQAGSATFNNLGTSIAKLQTGTTVAQQFGGALKSSLLGIVGPAAAAGAALGALSSIAGSFVEAFKFKTQLDATTASVNSQLGSVRNMSTVWAEAAATGAKYRITQAQTNEILANSVDVLRTSKASVGDLEIALLRLGSRDPSKPISEASRALRELNAGDVTTIKDLFNVSAGDAGRMKREIEGGADAVQVLSGFLDRAGSGMNILEQRTKGALGAINDAAIASEQLMRVQGELANSAGAVLVIQAQTEVTTWLRDSLESIRPLIGATQEAAAATVQLGGAFDEERTAVGNAQIAHAELNARIGDGRRESILLSQASQDAAIASQTDASAKQLLALQTQLLSEKTNAAAAAFLAANPGINESGIRAAVAAGLIPRLTGEIAILTSQIRAAKAELGGIASGRPEQGGDAIGRNLNNAAAAQRFLATQAERAAAAQRQQVLATGTQSEQVKILAEDYAKAVRSYGENSAEAINAQTKLLQSQRSAARGGGGGGGAPRLDDQTKLNNSLLANQEKYQDQAEQAERQHTQRRLDIEREFQKRSLAQQKANEISKRDGELGFLKSITASELNETEKGRAAVKQINDRFYADFDAAQKAAQAGNAAQSEAMVELARKRAETEQQYAEQIAEAEAKKQQDQVALLESLRAKERQILDERQKQIAEGGDADVNARNESLASEQARYEESQGKIGTAAEQAAERKILAAQRAGKAVADENALLAEQERLLNRMSASPASLAAAGGPAAGTAPAAGAAAAPGTVADLASVVAALRGAADQISAAVVSVEKAVKDDTRQTTQAVRSMGSRLVME